MAQLMTFTGDGIINVSECYDNAEVVISFLKQGTSGNVTFNERYLRELRKWLTIQIRKQSSLNIKKRNATPAKK